MNVHSNSYSYLNGSLQGYSQDSGRFAEQGLVCACTIGYEFYFNRVHATNGEVENNWKAGDFSFKNKTQFHCVPTWKAPVTFTEGTYETKPFNLTFKYDSAGKTSAELKMKQLASGLTVTAKAAQGKAAIDGEVVAEYLLPDSNVHSSLTLNSHTKFAFSTAFKPNSTIVLGAEVSGTTNMTNLKATVSNQVTMGKTVVGTRLTNEINSGATQLEAVLGFTEGKTNLLVAANHKFTNGNLPSATFLVKHNVDKNLWVKAAVNDALEMKVASGYRVSDSLTTTVGFSVNQAAKTSADMYRVGVKAVFSL